MCTRINSYKTDEMSTSTGASQSMRNRRKAAQDNIGTTTALRAVVFLFIRENNGFSLFNKEARRAGHGHTKPRTSPTTRRCFPGLAWDLVRTCPCFRVIMGKRLEWAIKGDFEILG